MAGLGWVVEELEVLRGEGLLREPTDGRVRDDLAHSAGVAGPLLDVTSNDYLGLARTSVSRETLEQWAPTPLGAGASRLIFGTHPAHDSLEHDLAEWTGFPCTLLFTSGCAANTGTVAALVGPSDLVVSDVLNHASLIDGCRLSRATVRVVPHLDLDAAAAALAGPARRKLLVTESYFSMDGNTPDLPRLRELCDASGAALLVDEAHALGVFGPSGAGLCAATGIRPDVLIGTLGKAVGSQGAFVATTPSVRQWLWNRARTFVFSTAMSPLLAQLTREQVHVVREAANARHHLHTLATSLSRDLQSAGLRLPPGHHGPIVPILLGDPQAPVRAAAALLANGILAQPIRPPTVPPGTARLRVTLAATMTSSQLRQLTAALIPACQPVCPPRYSSSRILPRSSRIRRP